MQPMLQRLCNLRIAAKSRLYFFDAFFFFFFLLTMASMLRFSWSNIREERSCSVQNSVSSTIFVFGGGKLRVLFNTAEAFRLVTVLFKVP